MPQEMRIILFTASEVKEAVSEFLFRTTGGKAPPLARVDMFMADGEVAATAYGRDNAVVAPLKVQDLLASLLIFCRKVPIPIPRTAPKRLDVAKGCLVLTMTLSAGKTEPRVEGGSVVYGAAGIPALPTR